MRQSPGPGVPDRGRSGRGGVLFSRDQPGGLGPEGQGSSLGLAVFDGAADFGFEAAAEVLTPREFDFSSGPAFARPARVAGIEESEGDGIERFPECDLLAGRAFHPQVLQHQQGDVGVDGAGVLAGRIEVDAGNLSLLVASAELDDRLSDARVFGRRFDEFHAEPGEGVEDGGIRVVRR